MTPSIEALLPKIPEFQDQYIKLIESGKQHLIDKRIVIVGLVRNLETKLENNIYKLCDLGQKAKNYQILLFENDSQDQTVEKLKTLRQNNSHIDFKSHTLNRPHFGPTKEIERTTALAEYRNALKLQVSENYRDYDYTIVCDMDFKDININGIYNSFGWFSLLHTIDAIAGNSFEQKYMLNKHKPSLWNYDSWAFRYMWWTNLYLTDETIINQSSNGLYSYDPNIWFGFFIPPLGSNLIPVNSAFGGMTIYKTNRYITGEYSGYDCEHVCFHRSLKDKYSTYNIYVNPSQAMLV
jgi:hypothetical protein